MLEIYRIFFQPPAILQPLKQHSISFKSPEKILLVLYLVKSIVALLRLVSIEVLLRSVISIQSIPIYEVLV